MSCHRARMLMGVVTTLNEKELREMYEISQENLSYERAKLKAFDISIDELWEATKTILQLQSEIVIIEKVLKIR